MNYLIDEYPLVVLPALAKAVGLNEAIILQQVHYWCARSKTVHDGHAWAYNTAEEWQEQFCFWHVNTVRRTLQSLREKGLLVAMKLSENKYDHTLYYRVDYDVLEKTFSPNWVNHDLPNLGKSFTETTTETSVEYRENKKNPLTPKAAKTAIDKEERLRERLGDFHRLWTQYPKKSAGYSVSLAAMTKLSNADWERAKETLPLWITSWQKMEAEGRGQYIPHLSTFLNQRRFENPPEGFVLGRAAPEAQSGSRGHALVKVNRFTMVDESIVDNWVNQWRGITFDYAVKNPDGSVVLYSKDRGSAPPIVIPKEDVDEGLQRSCQAV